MHSVLIPLHSFECVVMNSSGLCESRFEWCLSDCLVPQIDISEEAFWFGAWQSNCWFSSSHSRLFHSWFLVAETHQHCLALFSLPARHIFFFFSFFRQSKAFFLTALPMQQPFCPHCPEYQCVMFGHGMHCSRCISLFLVSAVNTLFELISFLEDKASWLVYDVPVSSSHNNHNSFFMGGR